MVCGCMFVCFGDKVQKKLDVLSRLEGLQMLYISLPRTTSLNKYVIL